MEWLDEDDLLAGVTLGLAERDVASETARQLLAALRGERASAPLVEAARLGRAVGLSVSEMERMSGYTRQTIYAALRTADQKEDRTAVRDRSALSQHVLVALGSMRGEVPVPELAHRMALPPEDIARALQTLNAERLCELKWRDPSEGLATMSAEATEAGMSTLRRLFNDLFLSRPDGFSVYLRVDPTEAAHIAAAADVMISSHEHTLMAASVAPSTMSTPELGLTVHAPTSRVALDIATDIWDEIRQHAGLPRAVAQVADLISPTNLPCGESGVVDAFTEALISSRVAAAETVTQERMRYRGGNDERSLACRCLTSGARSFRRSLEEERDPRPITDAEAAFGELAAVSGLVLDADRAPIQRLVRQALELAADRLGPFRGGELGSFRAPGGAANVVEPVQPSQSELEQMARLAGEAVGLAAGLGRVDPALEVRSVIAPVS